ncbi:MAG: hypothetical protein IPH62_02440 [Ignavibacteriae bacterium]|nr:hypothetical protein [Ignavibacteriota bacterium]
MKNIISKFLLLTFLIGISFSGGCDELNNLPVNIPIVVNFSTSGNNTTISESENFCLSDYEKWRENQDKVQSATYLSAAYWTESASAGLQGDINVQLSDQFGNIIFSVVLNNYKAADNIDKPFTLELTESEIQALNDYLELLSENDNDQCFNSSLTISDITGTTTPYQLTGRVEIVIEAAVEL